MKLRVTFREEHESGEFRCGASTSLSNRGNAATRGVVALGVNLAQQFRSEIESGHRAPRSFIRGAVESPPVERLEELFAAPAGFGEPAARLRQPHRVSEQLWPVHRLLGIDSRDVLARVWIEPSAEREPLHAHDHSDRLVLLTSGSGVLHCCGPEQPAVSPMQLELRPGDLVFLARGAAHVFHAGPDGAEALVWHCPYVAHGEPRYQTDLSMLRVASAS